MFVNSFQIDDALQLKPLSLKELRPDHRRVQEVA